MSEKEAAKPDWVNDVSPGYTGLRCQHEFDPRSLLLARRFPSGQHCGLPVRKGTFHCPFHSFGDKRSDEYEWQLEEAVAGGAFLADANLQGMDLSQVKLTKARLAGADLSGIFSDEAEMLAADLSVANLTNAVFSDGDLRYVRLHEAHLEDTTLFLCDLTGADLRAAHFIGKANLRHSTLTNAHLAGAEFPPEADLDGVFWWDDDRTWWRKVLHLDAPCFRDERELSGANSKNEVDRILRGGDFAKCERTYRQIKRCYQASGQYDMAGTFFVREMECKRKQLPLWSPMRAVYHVLHFVSDYFENPWRVVVIGLLVILLFAFLHGGAGFVWATGKDVPAGGQDIGGTALTLNPFAADWATMGRALYFSAITFTATGYGDYVPAEGWGQFIAALESLTGVFLMAMFLVCLARKFGRA
ncbi:MAG: pentapeptide repeat-containing protein [Armatimonadetes bacterium]|nr:pentapeptide repeat-containing protein [Armatimonadota bacterium]